MLRSRANPNRALLVVNVVLLVGLAVVTLGANAGAQGGGGGVRPRGHYVLQAGKMMGSTSHAIYVVDTTNQEAVALRWNNGTSQLEGLGYRNLAQDADPARGR